MFHRVFIANRGEVAARIVRACRALDLEAVCAASSADLEAGFPYLEEADEVVCLGPGPAAQSYLRAELVVQAAVQTRCTALHPGWGFLAENASFAALCAQHGVRFVGPDAGVIDLMGRKLAARRAAYEAGLPVVPGSADALHGADEAVRAAEEAGYPVALKADAGGGGRGIRRCTNAEEVRAAFGDAAREAASAFGDATLYLEKYLEGGRHVEFQVLGDGRGRAIHLGERDCSVQRRHQKLVEEAPSPALDAEQRARAGEACARAAAQWRYAGAGTMEFLLDADGTLHFLEMNTRLQVEHPVTEAITGVDLVEAQLRVAAGQELPCTQDEVRFSGHAIEVRLNAEDPDDDFRPAPGRLDEFDLGGEGVRVDTHCAPGCKVPPHYDSLIAKVIAHGEDREQARTRLDRALADARISGVPTTRDLHRRILASGEFRRGACDTTWLGRWLREGREASPAS